MLTERQFLEKLKDFDKEWKGAEPAPDMDFEPLPSGNYEAIVIDAKLTESSNGNIGLNVQFEVTKGDFEGRYLFHSFWFTYKNAVYVKRDLAKMGYAPNSAQDLVHAKRHLMNKKIILHVGMEQFEGQPRNKVKRFSKLDSETHRQEMKDERYQF